VKGLKEERGVMKVDQFLRERTMYLILSFILNQCMKDFIIGVGLTLICWRLF